MTLDPPDTPVSVEDARLCVSLVSAHLNAMDGRQAHADARQARLDVQEGEDRGQEGSGALALGCEDSQMSEVPAYKLWNENLAFPETVSQLHEAIENLGPGAWRIFTRLWEIACEIPAPPENQRQQKTASVPCPSAEPHKPDTPLLPLPANAPLLEEGLHRELPGMPEKVAAFLLHVPRDPPAWRYCESLDERSQREQLESEGCWTG
jgi:hypothetical protein